MATIVEQLGAALGAAHKAGIIHRDLKPANIMYDPATQTAKLLDFGIARDAELNPEERLTRAGFFVGTLQYVAPETLSGELVNEQADVYSLATIAYYMLTQELPFTGKSPRELFQQLLTQPPVPLNQAVKGLRFPGPIEAAVMRGLDRDLSKRSKTVDEFAGDVVHGGPAGRGKARLPVLAVRQGRGVTDADQLRRLLLERSVRRGDFVLASGQRSSYYIDCRLTHHERRGSGAHRAPRAWRPSPPPAGARARSAASRWGRTRSPTRSPPRAGGRRAVIDAFSVRKEAKGHGTGQLIEGNFRAGRRGGRRRGRDHLRWVGWQGHRRRSRPPAAGSWASWRWWIASRAVEKHSCKPAIA